MKFSGQITIPNSVVSIGRRAFATNLFETITIPKSVSYIGPSIFGSNPNLKSIYIDPQNDYYTVIENLYLYDKMKTQLIQGPYGAENFSLEPTLVEIGYGSIDSIQVKEIRFPIGFARILDYSSIQLCSNLETIYFGGNLFSVAANAINSCDKLAHIYYYGTIAVTIKFFTFASGTNSKIYLCNDYQGTSFASFTDLIINGVCPPFNYLKKLTCVHKNQIIINPSVFLHILLNK